MAHQHTVTLGCLVAYDGMVYYVTYGIPS